MTSELEQALQIRYVKLHFTIEFIEDTKLPRYKTSAIRGGMGEMLLRANCIKNRKCEDCDFESECIVQRTMYSKFELKPEFVTEGESVGFTLECHNHKEIFDAGNRIDFQLTLFGKTIVYLSQYMQAIYSLGMEGLGKHKSKFRVVQVLNTKKEPLLDGQNVYMERYQVERVDEYVKYRYKQLTQGEDISTSHYQIQFYSPLTLKYQGEFLEEYQMLPVMIALKRRIYMLDCYENMKVFENCSYESEVPTLLEQNAELVHVPRYSSRHKGHMTLHGIKGYINICNVSENALCMLLAGEVLNVGKSVRFGFGDYRVIKIEN